MVIIKILTNSVYEGKINDISEDKNKDTAHSQEIQSQRKALDYELRQIKCTKYPSLPD